MKKRTAIFVAGTACVLALAGCGRQARTVEKQPVPVRVVTVGPHGAPPRTRYSASIEPYEQVTLAFKASGYVYDIRKVRGADGRSRNLQEGDAVSAGSVLARIHDAEYVARRNQAKASLAEAQAGLERARQDFERADRLFHTHSLTKPDYDAARASLDSSQARVDSARAKLSEAAASLADTVLTAPADGVVLARQIETGALVSPGSPGFVIAQTDSMKAVFGVPDWLVREARLGMTLPVRVESLGAQEFPGRITAISPIADSTTRLFQVELTVRNSQGTLKAGLIATVEVPEADPEAARAQAAALVVPLAAIVRPAAGKFAVLVMEGEGPRGIARQRAVEVGEVYGNMVEIRQGLRAGERVVVSGASLLAEGETIQVIP
jgi:multidrug efflux system membrane fusion protein